MPDDVEINLGADTDEGRKEFRRLAAEIEKTGVVIKQVAEQGEKTGNRITEAMGGAVGTIGKVAIGYLSIETAIKAAHRALELYNEEQRHRNALEEKSLNTRAGLAQGRAGAIREGMNVFGGGAGVDAEAQRIAQRFLIGKDSAYGIIGAATGAGGNLSRDVLQSQIEEAARIKHFDAGQDSTALANLLVRTRKALGVGSGSQTAGFLGQFAEGTSEQNALAGVLQTAGVAGVDPRQSGSVFEYLSNIADSPDAAGSIAERIFQKGQFKSGVEAGFTINRKGETVGRNMPISGTGIDRIRSLATAFQAATPEQQQKILQAIGVRGGGPEEAGVVAMLRDPAVLAQLEARSQTAAAPGSRAAVDIQNRILREVSGGVGRDWTDEQARTAAAQLDEERNVAGARMAGIRASALQVLDKSELGPVARDYWRQRITGEATFLGSGDAFKRYLTGTRFRDDPVASAQEFLDTTGAAGKLGGADFSVQDLRNQMAEYQRSMSEFRQTNDRLVGVLEDLANSIGAASHQAPGPRSGEVH